MRRSTSRILTTHTGSLPRSSELQDLLRKREDDTGFDRNELAAGVRAGVAEVVDRQRKAGISRIRRYADSLFLTQHAPARLHRPHCLEGLASS